MKQIYESQVQDELTVCPYCMNPPTRGQRSCCGEIHYEPAIDTGDEIYLLSEVEIIPDLPPGSNPVVPLEEVKKALKVASKNQEIYSSATLQYLVQKYTVFMVLLAIGFSGCAPFMQQEIPRVYFEQGPAGQDGKSCTVSTVANGALIACPDGTASVVLNGTNGQNGTDGQNTPPTAYSVVEVIDPCGKQAAFDEVLLKLANGQIMAHFASGAQQFLALIGPGSYSTSDSTHCYFTITNEGAVTNEHN